MSDAYGYIPSSPQTASIRPLNLGMVTNIPPVAAKENSFQLVDGFDVTERGLRHHGGWQPALRVSGASIPVPLMFPNTAADADRRLDERIEDMLYMWLQDGVAVAAVVTNRLLYAALPNSGYAPVYWCREYVVQSYSQTTHGAIVLAGDYRGDLLDVGDWVVQNHATTPVYYQIAGATYDGGTNQTTVNLLTNMATPFVATDTFRVLKPFKATGDYYVDFTYGRYKTYLVDGFTPMVFQFDGTWLSPLVITDTNGNRTVFGARTITHYKDRLFFGGTMESVSGALRNAQRLRWTEVLDWTKSAFGNYQDLMYRQGVVLKILGYAEVLMAYTTDGVYYGRQTSMPSLPYGFYQMETGGAAAVGMKAICGFLEGQLFVSTDDVYFIGPGPSIQRVGTVVADDMLAGLAEPGATRMRLDQANSRVVVAPGATTEALTSLWFWNYKSKGWSKSTTLAFSALATVSFTDQLIFDDVPGGDTIDGSSLAGSAIRSLLGRASEISLYGFTPTGHLMYYDRSAPATSLPVAGGETALPVYGQLVTQDFEFDLPDADKTVLELSLRTTDLTPGRSADIRFMLEGSVDAGRTWRPLGFLRIVPGDDEDSLNFRLTGSALRFRLTTGSAGSATDTNPELYEVAAYTLRVRKRGPEAQRATTRPT